MNEQTENPTPYEPSMHKRLLAPTSDVLRTRILGWGVDLDPKDRPSVPRLQIDSDVDWSRAEVPEQQVEKRPRERSIEHARLTPVFGTSCPLNGVSGAMRRFSYGRFSEGRAAHWVILVAADRVDAAGAHLRSLLALRPDPVASGMRSELTGHGLRSRRGAGRSDVKHQWMDPIIVLSPWIAVAAVAVGLRRRR